MVDHKKLFIMRHGQTQWNLEKRQQGQKNSDLTDKGRIQAKKLAEKVRDLQMEQLFTSPLDRALQTAQIICENITLEPTIDDRLKECSFGLAEGLTSKEIEDRFPNFFEERAKTRWTYHWPEGESYEDVYKRISNFLDNEILLNDTQNVWGIVSHESANKTLIGKLMNLNEREIPKLCHPNSVIFLWQKGEGIKYADCESSCFKWKPGLIYKGQNY